MNNNLHIQVGQLLMVGFDGLTAPDELLKKIKAGQVGGVILFSRNYSEPVQIAELVYELKKAALSEYPLLVGIDQEGGRVQRIKEPLAIWPSMQKLASLDDPLLTEKVGNAIGHDLNLLGFNLDFAPVLDVVNNNKNTVIGDRSFGSSTKKVIEHALAFMRGLQNTGIVPCGKHFPGHGGPVADSHLTLPVENRSEDDLCSIDLVPFDAAIRANIPMLMSAHVLYPAWDSKNPATFSQFICTTLLRHELRFRGILISDDMEMAAVSDNRPIGQAAIDAIDAGIDLILICRDVDRQNIAFETMLEKSRSDSEFEARICESFSRIRKLKNRLPVFQKPLPKSELISKIDRQIHADLLARL